MVYVATLDRLADPRPRSTSSACRNTQYTQFVSWDGKCDQGEHVGVKYDGDARWPTGPRRTPRLGEVTQSLRSLWYYHQDV